jgi:hypothetical protein
MSVIAEIAAERERQIKKERFSESHDDGHFDHSLAAAAAAYAWLASLHDDDRAEQIRRQPFDEPGIFAVIHALWPKSWGDKWFKPKTKRRDLIRSAALIVAEIERLDRATPPESKEQT